MASESSESESDRELNEFVRLMGRHLVLLTGIYQSYDNGKLFHTGVFAFSGFVLNLEGYFFWVTAGHCLDSKFDQPIKAGKLKVVECGFADYFGNNAKHVNKIPYSYEPDCGFYIDDPECGLDFGVISLSPLIVQNLAANGVIAVERKNWIHQKDLEFSHYCIYGVPSHLSDCEVTDGAIRGTVQPVLIGIHRIDPNEVDLSVADTWFVGRIPPQITIKSIEGMSGGPIYGFRRNKEGQMGYHVVALQSRWLPDSRITLGCSVPLFAEELHRMVVERFKRR